MARGASDGAVSFEQLYDHRLDSAERAEKARLWRALCRSFFQRHVHPEGTVLDIGAGFCEFVNNIHCWRRLAVDTREEVAFASDFERPPSKDEWR